MNKATKIAATAVSSLGLVGGFAGIVGAAPSISTTGPDSYNAVKAKSSWRQRVTNNNSVGVSNTTGQSSSSGGVNASGNTTVGDAESGAASNSQAFGATLSLTNSAPTPPPASTGAVADGSIDTTGPNSTNVISTKSYVKSKVENNNTVSVSNSTSQSATTGLVNVSGNTTGGSATSGDATNTSTSTFNLNISN